MASVSVAGSAQAYAEKNKAEIDGMVTVANTMTAPGQVHPGVRGFLVNRTKGDMKFLTQHDWSGRNKHSYSQKIEKKNGVTFVHSVDGTDRADMAAVVYVASTNGCPTNMNCAYLLAWSVNERHGCIAKNKVYVETGKVENYKNINWNSIKAKLQASSNLSYCVDKTTGCEAFAKIGDGKDAALVATCNTVA